LDFEAMLSLTRKTDYALVALAALADQAATGQQISAREIAERYATPLPLMMNVLKRLHRAGLIESMRGAKGGYKLMTQPRELPLTRVIDAIEGRLRVTACCEQGVAAGSLLCQVSCPITGSIQWLNEQVRRFLSQFTLADLMAGAVDKTGAAAAGLLVSPTIRGQATVNGSRPKGDGSHFPAHQRLEQEVRT
jgi:Rrf2 family protein